MKVVSMPWAAVGALAQVVTPAGVHTVLPSPHPLTPYRALRDAAGVVHVIGIDPAAQVQVLVPDLADALVCLRQAGFDFTFVREGG